MTKLIKELSPTIQQYKSTLEAIRETKESLDALMEVKKSLEETILQRCEDNKPYETMYGTLYIETRRKYGDWPADIQKKDEELKALKAESKKVGNLDYEITRIVKIKDTV